jgi:hypothetical protein
MEIVYFAGAFILLTALSLFVVAALMAIMPLDEPDTAALFAFAITR